MGQNASVLKVLAAVYLGVVLKKLWIFLKIILFSQNNNPVKIHSPRRETTAVHCTSSRWEDSILCTAAAAQYNTI